MEFIYLLHDKSHTITEKSHSDMKPIFLGFKANKSLKKKSVQSSSSLGNSLMCYHMGDLQCTVFKLKFGLPKPLLEPQKLTVVDRNFYQK